jgi:Ras-related protein Rab-2A
VGKSSLLVRLTDQRFLANPDPTVCIPSTSDPVYCTHVYTTHQLVNKKLGVEFGSKLITIPEEDNKVVKLQCAYQLSPTLS